MSEPVVSVSERRIRPIQDAIASANWKQALQLCDKWSKKGERSEKFLAVKAFALVSQPDKAQHGRGKQEVLDLCKRTPAVTEPEAIYQLQHALTSLSLEDESPKLWERALTVKKDDKDLYMRWLNQAIADNNWRSAQKATMGLRNSFPKERQYEFWNILMCFLINRQEDLPEKDRMLFGTLAYRMISKAAEGIPKDEDHTSSSAKAISEPEEIALLKQVFSATGHIQEASKLFQGESLSIGSRLGKKDPQLILSLLLESLESSEEWNEALRACQELLSLREHQSDDRIWSLWLKARMNATDSSLKAGAEDTLESVCKITPIVRPAHLAKLSLLRGEDGHIDQESLLQSCQKYAEAFSEKAFCFDDLKESIRRLDQPHRDSLMQTIEQRQGNLTQLFALKIMYGSLPADTGVTTTQNEALRDFAFRALTLYSSTDESPICSEAAVLAALAVLRLQIPDTHSQKVLAAITILEIARSDSEDYYILTILLILLQVHLGLLSLAMNNFMKITIKNMQWETVGHLILTRISTLHPAFNGDSNSLDPLAGSEQVLKVLQSSDSALIRGIREGLRFNSYSNIHNSARMRSDIERSMNKRICAIEGRKVSRWRGLGLDDSKPPLPLSPSMTLVDKRDFSYLPSYRDDDRSLLSSYQCGPQPKVGWIEAMALSENVSTYLKEQLSLHTITSSAAYGNIKQLDQHFQADKIESQNLESEMTEPEQIDFCTIRNLSRAIVILNETTTTSTSPQEQKLVQELLADISSFLQTSLDSRRVQKSVAGVIIPTWSCLHADFSKLDTLQVIADFLTWLSKKLPKGGGKPPKPTLLSSISHETISTLQTQLTSLNNQIHTRAKSLKSQLHEPGVLGQVVNSCMARLPDESDDGKSNSLWKELGVGTEWEELLSGLCDEPEMEIICGEYRESWDDALDGVLGSKIRGGK